jgi:Protein of unknown function (DUF1559)
MKRLLLLLSVVMLSITSARAAEPPHPLAYVSPSAVFFLHADIAAIYDAKLGEAIKGAKGPEVERFLKSIETETGVPVDQIKSYTQTVPVIPQGSMSAVSVLVTRKTYDRKALIKRYQSEPYSRMYDAIEKDNILTLKPKQQFYPAISFDLRADDRYVAVQGLDESHFTPAKEDKGFHSALLKDHKNAHFLMGVNCNGLPDELRDEQNAPPEIKILMPLAKSDGGWMVGTVGKDSFDVVMTVKGKSKPNAEAISTTLEAGKTLIGALLEPMKKSITETLEAPKPAIAWIDVLGKSLKDAKVEQTENTITAKMSVPLKESLSPLVQLIAGGGQGDAAIVSNNLKQLGLSMHNYESTFGNLPAPASLGKKGGKELSWRVHVLPYIEQDNLYKLFKLDEPWDSEHNLKVMKDNPMPKTFAIPGTKNEDDKKTHYQVFVGNGAMFDAAQVTKLAGITDGTSNTLMVGLAEKAVEWTKPDDIEFDPKEEMMKKLWFNKAGKTFVCYGDGSVRSHKKTLDETTLKALITRNGGEVINNIDD